MKTMPKIDQPIPFDKPIELKNTLLEIQKYHRRILRYIRNFDAKINAQRRRVAADLPGILRERERRKKFQERLEAERRVAQKRKPLHEKRRSIPPKRININSFSGKSYQ